MDTTNHNNSKCSAMQNTDRAYCFAPEKQVRGVYFDVEFIPLTILHINRQNEIIYSLEKGKSPPFLRQMEGFCKEKEKLFAKVRGGPPWKNNGMMQKLRENLSDFAGFVVLADSLSILTNLVMRDMGIMKGGILWSP